MIASVSLVRVQMAGRACAIPCTSIVEIVPQVMLDQVPDSPAEVIGILNLRGDLVPVLDVRKRVAGREPVEYQYIVIVRDEARAVGLAVDDVGDVIAVNARDIARPGALRGGKGPGIVRVEQDSILVLNPEDVIDDR